MVGPTFPGAADVMMEGRAGMMSYANRALKCRIYFKLTFKNVIFFFFLPDASL